jgi:hypothetical protein
MALVGTCAVIGDGVFTPAISGNFTRTNFSTFIEQAS